MDEVQEFCAYIDSITEWESNSKTRWISKVKRLTPRRQKEVTRWIENEQVLCGLDSSYWESRYAWVCNPPEAPIWMADYTFKPIGEIKPGDEIIGWKLEPLLSHKTIKREVDALGRKTQQFREHLCKTRVISVNRRVAPIVKVTMVSGDVIRCTPDHLWSSGEHDRGKYPWIPARVGKHLRKIVDLYPNEPPDLREAAWLGGMYDGEGSGNTIAQYRTHNPEVHARLIEAMKMFDFKQKFRSGQMAAGGPYAGYDDKQVRINGEITGKAKFAAWCRPTRMRSLEKTILQTVRAYRDEIVDIQPDGEGEVVSMKTETGNYVAWGYASKNCDEKGQIFKFKNRRSQEVFDSVIAEFDAKQVSIELLILKARQLGVSTKTALKFIHRLMFIPHVQAVMASVQRDKSELIGRILDTAYSRCPWWLIPGRTAASAFKRVFDNGSILSIQSGMQATGLAQGWTPTSIHISELADIPDPKKTIEEGLFRAAHSSKNLFMVLEGTGGGNTGWLADTWRASKEDWPKGLARLCPVFIPWPMAPDIYPEPDWLKKFPVPGDFERRIHETTRNHVAKCESFIRNTPYLAKIAGRDWRMPIEQKWFWQFSYDAACKNHTQKTWAAQMPADDFEALTGVHDSVFDPEVLAQVEDRIYELRVTDRHATQVDGKTFEIKADYQRVRRQPVFAYAITGHDVDDVFYPPEERIDNDREFIRVQWTSFREQQYEWTMVPLILGDEQIERNTMDCLLIYEWPKNGCYYACGVDTADGLGKEDEERSCLSVTRNRFGSNADVQVAELTSNRINSAQITAFAACVGAFYGPSCPDNRGMKYAIEQIQGPGDTCQHQLKMMGFFNHHRPRRYDSKKIKDDSSRKEGWYSNTWSVPMLMTRFVEAVNGGWYEPRSKWLIEELRTLERHETSSKSKMEHRGGQFDDRVRAAAQSYFTAHDMDVLTERSQKRYALPIRKKEVSREVCRASQVSVGGW